MTARPPGSPTPRTGHRLFLDANVLFSAAYREGAGVGELWALGRAVTLLGSAYAIDEARRNLADAVARERLERLVMGIELVADVAAGQLPSDVALPEKDRPIMLAALAAGATHLLTGDRAHFGRYFGQQVAGMWIERPGDYLRRERAGERFRYAR